MQTIRFWLRPAVICAMFALLLANLWPSVVAAIPPVTRQRCFAETNHCISDEILQYWEHNGGLPVFGYPITDLRTETIEGTWTGPTQWFERDRLEDHSNEGLSVQAGRLGARWLELQGRPWQRGDQRSADTDCQWFERTGHQVCGQMLMSWQSGGGLMRFGYPLTELISEQVEGKTYQVQYFERRRMEYHSENAGTGQTVLLGLLGRDLLAATATDVLTIGALTVDPDRPVDPNGATDERAVYGYETVKLSVSGVHNAERVVFFADPQGVLGRDIGATTTITNGRATIPWVVPATTGSYTLYAQASDRNGGFVTSQAVPLVVLPAGHVPSTN